MSSSRALALFAMFLVWSAPAGADDFYVTITADTNDGICPPPFQCSLRDAILTANANPGHDTIHVPPGTYRLTLVGGNEDNSMTGDLDIWDDVTLVGAGIEQTGIDGTLSDRVFDRHGGGSAHLHGLRITGGRVAPSDPEKTGAGVRNQAPGLLLITSCVITGNNACPNADSCKGGGIYSLHGTVSILDTVISFNSAHSGGAVFAENLSDYLIINRSTVTGNSASYVSPDLDYWSGAITVRGSTADIINSTIAENEGIDGAHTGVVSIDSASVTITGCTIADNDGHEAHSPVGFGGAITFRNTIIKGRCGGSGAFNSDGGNVGDDAGNYCGFESGQDYWGVPIYLAPLADYGGPTPTMPPVYVTNNGNVAIDNVFADANCLPEDQRGELRPVDGNGDGTATCDSGAVEVTFGVLPFADGFESGDVGGWTHAVW